ncbi:MAG TPA: response regulator [Kofleriaceae bacterium]|nr:response regulator [Kofleriaceae bacterium]
MSSHPCVLLAEDDPDLREFVASRLTTIGYRVVPVSNGLEAMQYLSDTMHDVSPEPAPDLLITDIRMPQADGIDVLAYTRMWTVPTIIVTAFGTPETFEEARSLGAVACFSKPFDIEALCQTVREHAPRTPS